MASYNFVENRRDFDLHYLALEAQVRKLAERGDAGARALMAEVYGRHAYYLACLGSLGEARPLANGSLDLASDEQRVKDSVWAYAVFALARTHSAQETLDTPPPRRRSGGASSPCSRTPSPACRTPGSGAGCRWTSPAW